MNQSRRYGMRRIRSIVLYGVVGTCATYTGMCNAKHTRHPGHHGRKATTHGEATTLPRRWQHQIHRHHQPTWWPTMIKRARCGLPAEVPAWWHTNSRDDSSAVPSWSARWCAELQELIHGNGDCRRRAEPLWPRRKKARQAACNPVRQ
jgi:hypothetical protein